jgi:hypothetical protein
MDSVLKNGDLLQLAFLVNTPLQVWKGHQKAQSEKQRYKTTQAGNDKNALERSREVPTY